MIALNDTHETVYTEQPSLLANFFQGKSGVQFVHRYLAYIVVILIVLVWRKSKKMTITILQQKGIHVLLMLVAVQFILGVLTLLLNVPVILGVAHQVGAFLLLSAMTYTLHRFSK